MLMLATNIIIVENMLSLDTTIMYTTTTIMDIIMLMGTTNMQMIRTTMIKTQMMEDHPKEFEVNSFYLIVL